MCLSAPANPISIAATGTLFTGSGKLHTIVLRAAAANATLTLYDNTSAAGRIIGIAACVPNTSTTIDMKGLPFVKGIHAVIAGASADGLVTHE